MDIYLATGFALLVVGVSTLCRAHITRYLLLMGVALALSGCLSLRLGGNDKPQKTSETASASDAAVSMAQSRG